MKVIVKEIGNDNGKMTCIIVNSEDMFKSEHSLKNGSIFILACNTVSTGAYPTTVGFTSGIHSTIAKFVFENGPSEIIIGEDVYFIDIRHEADMDDFKKFENFRAAYSYAHMENERYWGNVAEGTVLSDLH